MVCSCREKKKTNFAYIESLAIKASVLNEVDYQIYSYTSPTLGLVYDFEPLDDKRESIVKYIYWGEYKK